MSDHLNKKIGESVRKKDNEPNNIGIRDQEDSFLQKTQQNGRKRNKNNKLYAIAQSELLGRYLSANRNINAGETITESEHPLVIGPVQQSQLLCLGCYAVIKNVNDYRCIICKWPMCSSTCTGLYESNGHGVEECKILADISFDDEMKRDVTNVYNFVVPLRCLLLKKLAQSKWKILMSMESHNKLRKKLKHIWDLNEKTVVQKIGKYFPSEEIHTVCGVLEVNCFDVTTNEQSLRALFPLAFLLSHNCTPNTVHTNDDKFSFRIKASVDIPKLPKGQPITISYAYTLQGTAKRRAHIKETKFFDCICDRCADPTELGTNCSTIICPKCCHATLVCSSPLTEDTRWICKYRKCSGSSVSASYVHDLIEKYEDELKLISDDDIEGFEIWLKKASNNFHENHYLILGVKYTICLLYGKIPGYMIQEMNEDLLKRKISLCQDLLKVADVIEPGLSRLRGILLYELHAPVMTTITQKSKTQNVSRKQMKHSLQKVIQYLKEACTILEFEGENTTEGKVGFAAKQALEATLEWEKIFGKF